MSNYNLKDYTKSHYNKDKYSLKHFKLNGSFPMNFENGEFNWDYLNRSGDGSITKQMYAEILEHRISRYESSSVVERLTGEKNVSDGLFGKSKESKDSTIWLLLLILLPILFMMVTR
jgi:hypothetical protein